jgi:hypothetical protein
MAKTLTLIVKPIGPSARRGMLFQTTLDSVELTTSHQPFLDSARQLLAQGVDPDTVLAMRHEGKDHDALRGRLGDLAKLTVSEASDGRSLPDFRPWSSPSFTGDGTVD